VFSIIELKTATLDYGIPGISPTHMLLVYLMMFAVSMIPYLFLFLSLRDKRGLGSISLSASPTTKPFRKIFGWLQAHRHPELLHHH
jgi:hypothetical protein